MGQTIKKIKKWFWRKKKGGGRSIPQPGIDWQDIAKRAAKTFLQAFVASIPVDAALLTGGWNVLRATLLSAAAAGLSAVMNLAIAKLQEWLREEDNDGSAD
jgi:hypothetical protein